MGKGLIAVVLIVAVIAVVAFIAYPMFFGDKNAAKKLQPEISAFPDGWSVDKSYSTTTASGALDGLDSYSKERYYKGTTDQVIVVIQVFSSVEKATANYDFVHGFYSPGTPVTKFDKCFKDSAGNYYFQSGKVTGQVLPIMGTSLTQAQIDAILSSIEGKLAA